jgi:glycosyltransferase involved in cell wall biosynthesis
MKVLHAISGIRATAGGTVAALVALADAQRRAGMEVSILSTFIQPETEAAEAVRAMGLAVHQVGPCRDPLSRHPDIGPVLRQLIPRHDVVHIHGLWEEIQHQAARQSRRLRTPHLFSPHGMLDPWSLGQGRWRKRLYLALRLRRDLQRAAAIHYTSDLERDLAGPLKLRPPAIVEPNGVALAEFQHLPPRGTFRARWPQIGDRPVVMFLGRLHYKKGFDLLIPALAAASQEGAPPQTLLVIAGPDEDGYRATIERMIDRAGVRDRVIFTGMLQGRERIEALVDADLFVLPSYQENFGIVVVEALAAGCPVVISDQVNIHPAVRAAGVGGVVPMQVEPLAGELARWLRDKSLRSQASSRAGRFVREHYDWNLIARRWIDHYSALRSGRGFSQRLQTGATAPQE